MCWIGCGERADYHVALLALHTLERIDGASGGEFVGNAFSGLEKTPNFAHLAAERGNDTDFRKRKAAAISFFEKFDDEMGFLSGIGFASTDGHLKIDRRRIRIEQFPMVMGLRSEQKAA